MLDIRQDSFVEVGLSTSVGSLPATRTPAALALALNTLVGGLTPASMAPAAGDDVPHPVSIAAAVGNGVPLALVLVLNGQMILLSQAAGRLTAGSDGLNAMLLAQMREAFTMALAETGADPTLGSWQTTIRARFRFLPGAGELPVGMLLTPEAVTASCPFFPPGMEVYLELIRASQAAHLLYEALGRSQVDLTSNNAEAVTLALAIPDAAWTPDLLDMPRGDPVLAADTHLAYARARAAQVIWRENWIALYGGMTAVVAAQSQAFGFLMASDTAARNLSYLLSLPPPAAPALPALTVDGLLTAADGAASPLALLPMVAAWIAALAATPPPAALAIPAVPTTDAATAAQQIAALGYQVVDREPDQADPTVATITVPVASDAVLAPLMPFLPANSDFADWSAAISAAAPDPGALLQPLIDAGIVDATATAKAQADAITALLTLPAGRRSSQRRYATGQAAPAGHAAAVLRRVRSRGASVRGLPGRTQSADRSAAPASRYHVHLDLRAGRRRSGGRQRAELHPPYPVRKIRRRRRRPRRYNWGGAAASPPPATTGSATSRHGLHGHADIFADAGYIGHHRGCIFATEVERRQHFRPLPHELQFNPPQLQFNPVTSGGPVAQTQFNPSLITSAPIATFTVSAPSASILSSLLGNQTDVAQSVAQQLGAITQAPTFQYSPVNTERHRTSTGMPRC